MTTTAIYKKRRTELLKKHPNSIFIFFSNNEQTRSNDTHFSFRQDSNLYYFSGFQEASSILILTGSNQKATLFLNDKDAHSEMWEGKRLGVNAAPNELDIEQAYNINQFESKIEQLLIGHQELYMDLDMHQKSCKKVQAALTKLNLVRRQAKDFPQKICSLRHLMGQIRLKKDQHEKGLLKSSASIAAKTHNFLISACSSFKKESQIEAFLKFAFQMQGAQGEAYSSIVASGSNANTLHYTKNNCLLNEKNLVLIDAGCEYQYYASDITRTFPLSGKFSSPQRLLYQIVLDVQKDCISKAKPGVSLKELHKISIDSLVKKLVESNILTDLSFEEVIEKEIYRSFYPHGLGHWIGLDVHDPSPSYLNENPIKLEKDMYITIEPGLYLTHDNQHIDPSFRGIGIRIEDNLMITNQACENFTVEAVKEVAEIEEQFKKDFSYDLLFSK